MQEDVLDKTEIRKSQRKYCSIVCRLATIENANNVKAAEEKLKCAEGIHESIWKRRDEAGGLSQDDEWVLENGHLLGVVLGHLAQVKQVELKRAEMNQADLKQEVEDRYRLAEIHLRSVWKERKNSSAFGRTHNDTVDSALQLVLMMEKQNNLAEEKKRADIEDILSGIWADGRHQANASILNCGHKLGELLCHQKKYAKAEPVLSEVWTARQQALVHMSKEASDARSTGFELACALYYQRRKEKYEEGKVILKKLWAKRNSWVSAEASPSNDSIGWRLAWTHRQLEEYAEAEAVFELIWETRKVRENDMGPRHAKTLNAQYELGVTQMHQKRWVEAERNFQHIWDTEKDGAVGEKEKHNTITRLNAGHQLSVCLLQHKRYERAIKVLEEVYNGKVSVFGQGVQEVKTAKMAVEDAQNALEVQRREKKDKAEEDARKRREIEDREAQAKRAREEALREEGRKEGREEGREEMRRKYGNRKGRVRG